MTDITQGTSARIVTEGQAEAADAAYEALIAQLEQGAAAPTTPQPQQTLPTQPTPSNEAVNPTIEALRALRTGANATQQQPSTTIEQAQPTNPLEQLTSQLPPLPQFQPPEQLDDATRAEYAQLEQLLNKHFGITPDVLLEQQQLVEQVQREKERNSLMTEWNVDAQQFTQRMEQVEKYWQTLPAHLQESLNNLEGTKLLWNALSATQANVPAFDRSTAAVSQATQPTYLSRAEIEAMDDATYAKHADDILWAYQNGYVR